MCVNKLGHLVTSFFSDSLTDVVAVARGVYGRYLRGGCGAGVGGRERGVGFTKRHGCICDAPWDMFSLFLSLCVRVSMESPC